MTREQYEEAMRILDRMEKLVDKMTADLERIRRQKEEEHLMKGRRAKRK